MSDGNMSMPMPMPMPMPTPMYPMDDMIMHMSFFWGKDMVILFGGWPGTGRLGMYILALVAVFVFAVGAEILSLAPRGGSAAAGAAIHAAVYGVRMALIYLVMLSVMSYNIGVFVVAVTGHAVGRFFVKYRAFTAATAVDSAPKF